MAPFYKALPAADAQRFGLDAAAVEKMEAANATTLAEIATAQEAAEKDSGG